MGGSPRTPPLRAVVPKVGAGHVLSLVYFLAERKAEQVVWEWDPGPEGKEKQEREFPTEESN